MTPCEDVLDLLPEALPRLTAETLAVQEHLRACPSCAEEAEELTRVLHALRAEAEPAPALPVDFAERVVAALPAGGHGAGARRWRVLAGVAGRVAAAAALVVAGFAAGRAASPPAASAGRPDPRVLAPTASGGFDAPGGFEVRVVGPDPARRAAPALPAPSRPALPAPPAGLEVEGPGGLVVVQGGPVEVAAAPVAATRAAAAARPRRAARGEAPLARYVSEAGLVLEAVAVLDHPDPHWLRVLARRVDEAALLDQGERLLVELRREPDEARDLRPLIAATQLVLRKVRHAPAEEPDLALRALRVEVESTGLLDAYRALRSPAVEPPAPTDGPF